MELLSPPWDQHEAPTLADIPPNWAGPWHDRIDQWGLDASRTAAIASGTRHGDVPIVLQGGNPATGGVWRGFAYSVVGPDTPLEPVWQDYYPVGFDLGSGFVFPEHPVPLPATVRRRGDPQGHGPDHHCIVVDPTSRRCWEMISMRPMPNLLPWRLERTWVCSRVAEFRTDRPFDAPGQPSFAANAIRVPLWPLLLRAHEVVSGHVDHALLVTVPSYSPEFIAPARWSDGIEPGHPLRGGERLRLRTSVVNSFTPGSPRRVVAEGLRRHGLVVGDKNSHDPHAPDNPPASVRVAMDRRLWELLGRMEFRMSDFEVVRQS